MAKFYQQLYELVPEENDRIVTVLGRKEIGLKALVRGRVLLWASTKEDDFFQAHLEEIIRLLPNRIHDLSGVPVFVEKPARGEKLILCGGGHVSMPIIRIGRELGFHTTVLEDRPKYADNAREAGADQVICAPFEEGLGLVPGDGDTFFVIVTRGHRQDLVCLKKIMKKPHAYIGMMGSKRRVMKVREEMCSSGFSAEEVEELFAPIGLSIGAKTPEEIAVSVMAQIIQVKNGKDVSGGYSKELLREILADPGEPKVLATIVSRKGSAPRDTGTRMLVFPDGRCVDTIGGGCMEAEIVQEARLILKGVKKAPYLTKVDLTCEDAAEEGMVCGGTVEVFLEEISDR